MPKTELELALEQKFEKVENELSTIKEAQIKKEDFDELQKSIETQGETLEEFLAKQTEKQTESFEEEFGKFLDENKDDIAKLIKKQAGVITFTPKAVAPMTTASGSVVGTPHINNDQNLGDFNLANYNFVNGLVSYFKTNTASFPYTELKPKEGEFAWVAEGAEKPQIDFTWVTRYAEPIKVAAYEILTDEVVKDIPRMKSTAKNYLRRKHDIARAKKIIEIAIAASRTFNAGSMANAVTNPVFMDVINAISTDVYTLHAYEDEASYNPNVAMVHPTDFFVNFVAAKDEQGRPLYPSASLFKSITVGGIKIIPTRLVAAGKVFVADMKYLNVTNWVPYSVSIGWINDQFIHNQFVMLGESRMHAFVKEHEKGVFVQDDYATVSTAIKKV